MRHWRLTVRDEDRNTKIFMRERGRERKRERERETDRQTKRQRKTDKHANRLAEKDSLKLETKVIKRFLTDKEESTQVKISACSNPAVVVFDRKKYACSILILKSNKMAYTYRLK